MLLHLAAFAAGALTIASPCILPVLPFVLSRADQPYRRNGLPLLAGMALSFVAVGTLAAFAGSWAARANHLGRAAALLLFAVFGFALLVPVLADRLSRPFVRLGAKFSGDPGASGIGAALLLGVSTGLLWTPCAGPILGLILTGAAVQGATARTALLLMSFACGAAVPMAIALLAGGKALAALKRALAAEEWIRRGLGAAVLFGALSIALGWDTGALTRLSLARTTTLEEGLARRVLPPDASQGERTIPPFDGAVAWLNSPPLAREALAGKVVLVDFWTYSCINCLREIPYLKAWARHYSGAGLVVVGVHSPEFPFERDPANVAKAVREFGIAYPVAIDSNLAIWAAFGNQFWPALYFVDARGIVRHRHFGEGEYEQSERVIRQLLGERSADLPKGPAVVATMGVEAAADFGQVRSPETYVGYARQEGFAAQPRLIKDRPVRYSAPPRLSLNRWALSGEWTVGPESAILARAPGRIAFRFHARNLHLVLGPGPAGRPARFRVSLDGAPPGKDRGMDVDAEGNGTIKAHRLYQLIRQKGRIEDRTFELELLDTGARAYAFTFG